MSVQVALAPSGNLPLFPASSPTSSPGRSHRADRERELVMARLGMPGPPQHGGAPEAALAVTSG